MAKTNIEGVTIEFDANVLPVEKALQSVNKEIDGVNKDLKKVNDALKLNPGDTEQVARKLELLAEKAELSEKKVDALKQAQEKMDAAGIDKSSKAYQDLRTELSKAESSLRGIKTEMETTARESTEVAEGQKQLSTYLDATGRTAEDLISIIGTKLVDAYKSGQLGARGYQRALELIAQVTTGSKQDIQSLRAVLSSLDDGVDLGTISAQLSAMGTESGKSKDNVVKLAREFSELAKGSTDLKTELNQINQALKLDPSNVELLTKKQSALAQSVDNAQARVKALKTEYRNLSPDDIGTEKFAALEQEINKTESELSGYQNQLSQTNVVLSGMDSTLSTISSKLAQVNQNLKFDPSSLDLLKQKQDLLTTAVTETGSKLSSLSAELKTIDPTTDLGKEKFNAVSTEIQNTSAQLTGYKTELSSVESEVNSLATNQQRLSTFFDATKTSLAQYANVLGSELTAAIESGKASASQLESAINKIGAECTGSSTKVDQLKSALDSINNGASLTSIREDIAKIGQESQTTKVEVEGLGDGLSSIGEKVDLGNALEGLDGVTDALSGLSDKLTEFGQKGLDAAQTVEGAQSDLQVKFGQTAEEATKTADHAHNVWANNFGGSIGEVANTMGLVQQAIQGVNDSNIEDITAKFQTLIDKGNDEQETVRAVNSIMQAFGVDAQTALDIATKGFQEIPSDELLDNLAEYSPLFKQVGLDGGQMLSVLKAGMDSGAYSTDKCADTIKEMGIRMNDGSIAKACTELGGNFATLYEQMSASGASQSDIFRALVGEIGNLGTEEEKVAATSALFGTQGEDSGYKVVQAMAAATSQTTDYAGAADKAKEANQNSVDGMIRKWQDLGVQLAPIGSVLADIGSKIADVLVPVIQKLSEWFSNLDPSIQTFIVAFGAAVAVIGPVVAAVVAFGAAIAAIGAPIGAVVAAIAGIAAAIAGLITLFTNWGNISSWISEQWNSFCAEVGEQWNLFCTDVSNAWNGMWQGIQDFFSGAVAFLQAGQEAYWGFITNLWTTCTQALQDLWNNGLNAIQNIWNTVSSAVQSAWSSFCANVQSVWDGFCNAISTAWNNLTTNLQNIWNTVSSAIQSAWDSFCSTVSNTWNSFVDGVKNIWQQGWNYVQDVVNNVKARVVEIIAGLVSAGQEKFEALKNFISDIWNNIKSTAESVWNGIVGSIQGFVDSIYNAIVGTFESIKNKVQEIWNNITGTVGGLWDQVGGFFGINYSVENLTPVMPVPEWHAKGGILTAPTLFTHGGTLHGAGEAGAEAIEPLDTLDARQESVVSSVLKSELSPLLQSLISEVRGLREDSNSYYSQDLDKSGNITIDGGPLVGYVDQQMARRQKINRRR